MIDIDNVFEEAGSHFKKQNYSQSMSLLDKITSINPLDYKSIFLKGLICLNTKKFSSANEHFLYAEENCKDEDTKKFILGLKKLFIVDYRLKRYQTSDFFSQYIVLIELDSSVVCLIDSTKTITERVKHDLIDTRTIISKIDIMLSVGDREEQAFSLAFTQDNIIFGFEKEKSQSLLKLFAKPDKEFHSFKQCPYLDILTLSIAKSNNSSLIELKSTTDECIYFRTENIDNFIDPLLLKLTQLGFKPTFQTDHTRNLVIMTIDKNQSTSNEENLLLENTYIELFDLAPSFTFEDIKFSYVNLIKKYHPDRVSHLGDEFKRLAEEKTKQLNTAYNYFKSKFQSNDSHD